MIESAPWIIIVTGRPASGKSTLAKWLGERLRLPVISKDDVKEILFDALGWSDREWSKELGRTSVELMFHFAEKLLETRHSLILDNAFHSDLASHRFRSLKQKHGAESLQIVCAAPAEILHERFRDRALNCPRHPGHVDLQSLDEYKRSLQSSPPLTLDVGGEVIEVDTTDFTNIEHEKILARIYSLLGLPSL